MIFDLHCDTIWRIWQRQKNGESVALAQDGCLQIDENKLKKGGYFAQCFAMFVPANAEDAYGRFKEMLEVYETQLNGSSLLKPVRRFDDFAKNREAGRISAVLTMEDAAPLGNSIERLRECYGYGVRMIGLTWNYPNAVGYPNIRRFEGLRPDKTEPLFEPETEYGLTDFGRELVREMNGLGIVVDVSHLSDKGFYDVMETSKKPIMASHSNARGLCRNVRNVTDDMLKKLADNGGIIGMNYAAGFLNEDEEKGKETISHVVRHMQYVQRKIGVEHIGIGSDFDGIDPNIELQTAAHMPLLVQALERAGFTADEIEKITYRNALRVFKENLK